MNHLFELIFEKRTDVYTRNLKIWVLYFDIFSLVFRIGARSSYQSFLKLGKEFFSLFWNWRRSSRFLELRKNPVPVFLEWEKEPQNPPRYVRVSPPWLASLIFRLHCPENVARSFSRPTSAFLLCLFLTGAQSEVSMKLSIPRWFPRWAKALAKTLVQVNLKSRLRLLFVLYCLFFVKNLRICLESKDHV